MLQPGFPWSDDRVKAELDNMCGTLFVRALYGLEGLKWFRAAVSDGHSNATNNFGFIIQMTKICLKRLNGSMWSFDTETSL